MRGQEGSDRIWLYLCDPPDGAGASFLSSIFSSFRVQHMDLSNSVINVSNLHGILSECSKLQNLSLEGLQLSDPIVKWVAPEVCHTWLLYMAVFLVYDYSVLIYVQKDIPNIQNCPGSSRQQKFEYWSYARSHSRCDRQTTRQYVGETDNQSTECSLNALVVMWQHTQRPS